MRAASPSAHNRRQSKNQRANPLSPRPDQNVATYPTSGSPDLNSVQDRIRQWQAQGAANAVAPDAVSVRSLPFSDCPSIASRPGSEHEDGYRSRGRGSTRKKIDEEQQNGRSVSAPRKRIISDGHWKAKSAAKEQKLPKIASRPRSGSPRYDMSYKSTRENQQERQHNFAGKKDGKQKTPGDDGIRVTAMPMDHLAQVENNFPLSYDSEYRINDDLAHHLTTESTQYEDFEQYFDGSIQGDGPSGSRRQSKYAESLGRAAPVPGDMDAPRSKKGGLFGKTRDIFLKPEALPSVDNRIPSIEAWLDEQPDPFVDQTPADTLAPVEVPRPLKKRSERKRASTEKPKLADPDRIWESVQPQNEPPEPPAHRSSVPREHKENVLLRSIKEDGDSTPKVQGHSKDSEQEHDGSPSPLRRRGARVRRQRNSPDKGSISGLESSKSPEVIAEEPSTAEVRFQHGSPPQRPYSPTGQHKLSTIASADTIKDKSLASVPQEGLPVAPCGLKRRLTTHEDLMSVLSQPNGRNRRSARRSRSIRAARASNSAPEVLAALVADEERYGRELKTLIEGVIPVLLQCVLSKAGSAAAAGLFSSTSTQDGTSFTTQIIEMGIALERLKTLHNRIPFQSVDSLLNWAQTAQKAYRDYLQAWRLGFQDVVVNLAPLEQHESSDQGMARDDAGDLIDTEGKKVDVAFLLKRPLVRVKALSKTFAQIRDQCDKPTAAQVADTYADLTIMARRRHHEEQGRLEDEAAANIDSMRTRDIRTMAATSGVTIDKSRRVKARDFFNLTLYHSSGQRMDCGVELVFRDNARGAPSGGDVLICEVDDTGKWLLFAPVDLGSISARRGESGFDLVVMIRGRAGLGQEWHELLALKTDDSGAATEWMTMLGSNPLPPRLNRTSSFIQRPPPISGTGVGTIEGQSPKQESKAQSQGQSPRPEILDVPIGEPSVIGVRTELTRNTEYTKPLMEKPLPRLNLGGGLASKAVPQYQNSSTAKAAAPSILSSDRSTISDRSIKGINNASSASSLSSKPTSLNLASPPEQREKATLSQASLQPLVPARPREGAALPIHTKPKLKRTDNDSREWMSSPILRQNESPKAGEWVAPSQSPHTPRTSAGGESAPSMVTAQEAQPQRPGYQRALSSTPSKELPTVAKVRPQQQSNLAPSEPIHFASEEQNSPPKQESRSKRSRGQKNSSRSRIYTEDVPMPPVLIQRQTRPTHSGIVSELSPLATPPKGSPATREPRSTNLPALEPKAVASPSDKTARRRTSSPLKHEYAPSTSSDSSSDYDSDGVSDSSSDTSESERGDMAMPLVAIIAGERRPSKPPYPPSSMPSTGTRTLAPSDSASQGPYRKVPASASVPAHKKTKTIALICSWSDRGMWEQIHPDECSIVVSPGLIEAFEMSAAHSDPQAALGSRSSEGDESRTSSLSQQPLVAFELTPIVPLRRGTALDISIRSPPTANSKVRTTNNVMFRSRNPEECEALYGMINWARCNNPTYIQLQIARPRQPSVTFNVGQDRHSRSKSSSWFSFGSQKESSYRASSAPTPASVNMSVDSSGTVASAFSALRKFGTSSAFNLNRSSVVRRNGGRGTGGSLYSSSSGTGTGSGSSTPVASQLGFIPGKDGPNVPSTSAAAANGGGMVNNMKIRLYLRKGQQWENLGAARLSVLPAPTRAWDGVKAAASRSGAPVYPSPPATPGYGRSPSNTPVGQPGQSRGPRLASSSNTPHRIHGHGHEKRIFIVKNKEREAVLLDSVLGESCFERIMQTGIAVKVWNEDAVIGHTGGVTMGRETVYMMQFPGTKEAGWVFGLCGTYRYAKTSE